MAAGYSGTPLAKKLGIKTDHRVATINEPADFRSLLVDLPDTASITANLSDEPDVVVAFYTERSGLEADLAGIEHAIFPDRAAWIAWPKKASKVPTDLDGNAVRDIVLRTKLVDVKVCAISAVWSGLKVVWRKEHR